MKRAQRVYLLWKKPIDCGATPYTYRNVMRKHTLDDSFRCEFTYLAHQYHFILNRKFFMFVMTINSVHRVSYQKHGVICLRRSARQNTIFGCSSCDRSRSQGTDVAAKARYFRVMRDIVRRMLLWLAHHSDGSSLKPMGSMPRYCSTSAFRRE
jgi:hypothetical protein